MKTVAGYDEEIELNVSVSFTFYPLVSPSALPDYGATEWTLDEVKLLIQEWVNDDIENNLQGATIEIENISEAAKEIKTVLEAQHRLEMEDKS